MSDSLRDPLAGCRAYLEAHGRQAARTIRPPRPIVTLSREAGAGAVTIGELAARLLNQTPADPDAPPWTVFDKTLVQRVIEDHQFPEALRRFLSEEIRPGITSAVEEIFGLHPSGWRLAEHTTETILRLAHLGNVILVGRGAHLITAKRHPAVHVRLVAPLELRAAHLAEYYHFTPDEALRFARQADQGRRRYVKRYFNADIADPLHYTLTINTGRIDYAGAAQLIAEAVRHAAAAAR